MTILSKAIYRFNAAAAKLLQSCPTLCDPIDGSPPGSPVPGVLQARILEWVAISFSSAMHASRFSCVWLCATPWTAAHQAPPSTEFSRQEYWSGLPLPSISNSYGEGNGNSLQCSCLENPRDKGAWWAAVYGVAQSWTQLKQLSSSSSIHPLFWLKIKRQLYQVLLMIQNNCQI